MEELYRFTLTPEEQSKRLTWADGAKIERTEGGSIRLYLRYDEKWMEVFIWSIFIERLLAEVERLTAERDRYREAIQRYERSERAMVDPCRHCDEGHTDATCTCVEVAQAFTQAKRDLFALLTRAAPRKEHDND